MKRDIRIGFLASIFLYSYVPFHTPVLWNPQAALRRFVTVQLKSHLTNSFSFPIFLPARQPILCIIFTVRSVTQTKTSKRQIIENVPVKMYLKENGYTRVGRREWAKW